MNRKMTLIPLALTLAALLSTHDAQAGTHPNDRRGWIVGFDFGSGGSVLEYKRPAGEFENDKDQLGAGLGLRLGYGLSNSFAPTFDSNGYGQEDDDWETAIGTSVLMATYHISGGGFFLRAGGGIGRVETELTDGANGTTAVEFKQNGPVLALGLGYEWRVGEKFALGLAIDSRGGSIEDFDDLEEITFGKSTLGLQFNWYL